MDKPRRNLRDYLVVTAAYWAFTLSDGALRMIILLELHSRGMSPIKLATLFLFYEAAGVVTNLGGGWIGARCAHGRSRSLQSRPHWASP